MSNNIFYKALAAVSTVGIVVIAGISITKEKRIDSLTCFIDLDEISRALSVYVTPNQHYHKVKGLYTWPKALYPSAELRGNGRLEVTCKDIANEDLKEENKTFFKSIKTF